MTPLTTLCPRRIFRHRHLVAAWLIRTLADGVDTARALDRAIALPALSAAPRASTRRSSRRRRTASGGPSVRAAGDPDGHPIFRPIQHQRAVAPVPGRRSGCWRRRRGNARSAPALRGRSTAGPPTAGYRQAARAAARRWLSIAGAAADGRRQRVRPARAAPPGRPVATRWGCRSLRPPYAGCVRRHTSNPRSTRLTRNRWRPRLSASARPSSCLPRTARHPATPLGGLPVSEASIANCAHKRSMAASCNSPLSASVLTVTQRPAAISASARSTISPISSSELARPRSQNGAPVWLSKARRRSPWCR
jgi:hypothetical protein